MYNKNNNSIQKSSEKLSSGFRINRAGDDAAGLAISEKMRAQIRGLNMASKNSNDAISLVQTAEGALQEVHTMLQRMNELAVQSASDTNVTIDRNALQLEFENLQEEIDQIAQTTKFNDTMLLDGSMGGAKGAGASVALTAVLGAGVPTGTEISFAGGNSGTNIDFKTIVSATKSVAAAWDATGKLTVTIGGQSGDKITADDINAAIAKASVPENFTVANENKGIKYVGDDIALGANTDASGSQSLTVKNYADATVSNTTANDVKNVTITATGGGELMNNKTFEITTGKAEGVSVAANGNITVTLDDTKTYTADYINKLVKDAGGEMEITFDGELKGTATLSAQALANGGGVDGKGGIIIQVGAEEGHTLDLSIEAMNTKGLGITKVDANIATREAAEKAITVSRNAINIVSTQRAKLGAMQNRLEYKISNLDITAENLQAAESRIRDVDMAKEMTNFTKNNILTQAATAMLAQANAAPQNVLQLLG